MSRTDEYGPVEDEAADSLTNSELEERDSIRVGKYIEPCPVCDGEGTIVVGPYDPIFGEDRDGCSHCDGLGYV